MLLFSLTDYAMDDEQALLVDSPPICLPVKRIFVESIRLYLVSVGGCVLCLLLADLQCATRTATATTWVGQVGFGLFAFLFVAFLFVAWGGVAFFCGVAWHGGRRGELMCCLCGVSMLELECSSRCRRLCRCTSSHSANVHHCFLILGTGCDYNEGA